MILFVVILFFLFIFGLKTPAASTFNKDIVTVLKPFLAFGVVLFHLHNQAVFLHEFERWGPLIVGIFFFISGYGLTYSLKNNSNYLNDFFLKKLLIKLVLPCLLAWILHLSFNETWNGYSIIEHLANPLGPSLFPGDWFMYALIYCYISFIIAGMVKSSTARLFMLVIVPLLLVIFTSVMDYERNWWATPLAFSVGVMYCYFEPRIRKIVSGRKNLIYSNILYLCMFGGLIVGAKYKITTILAYSLLPLLLINNIIRLNFTRLAKSQILLFLSGISFEIYLTHGIVIYFLKKTMSLSGISLVGVTIIITLIVASLFKQLSVNCQKNCMFYYVCSQQKL